MKLSKTLQKIARILKASLPPFEFYLSYGWITPHGILQGETGGDHFTVLDDHADVLGVSRVKNYRPAFLQKWVRWYIRENEIAFEATEQGFTEHLATINKLIDQNPDKRVFIEYIDQQQDIIDEFRFDVPSKAEKAFRRGGIKGLQRYNQAGSQLRKFL